MFETEKKFFIGPELQKVHCKFEIHKGSKKDPRNITCQLHNCNLFIDKHFMITPCKLEIT